MAAIRIKPETFKADGEASEHATGEVTLCIGAREYVAKAWRGNADGPIYVRGFVGRYRTSSKAWRATVKFNGAGEVTYVWFGRDDRRIRFNKQNAISYEPETFAAIGN